MLNKLTILFALTLVGCNKPVEHKETAATTESVAAVETVSLPEGFTIVEQQPQGFFIRVASSERASIGTIRTISASLSGKYDRIDLCRVATPGRGDEYASIIDGKLYDYENDIISSIE